MPQTMVVKKHLNEFEKGQIVAFHHENMSLRGIVDILGSDSSIVYRFLKNRGKKGRKERPRNGTKLTPTGKRRLLRAASNGILSAKQLKSSLNLPVTSRRVQQILHDAPHLKYRKIPKASALTPQHRTAREKWARRFVNRGNPF